MTTLEGRLRDPDYRNWVKSALCLQYTRDGLMTFTGLKSLELNQAIIQQLRLNGNPSVYNLCPTIAFDTRRKSITCCGNCNDILKEVMKYRPGRLDLNLRNSDPTQLLHQHWQCAKLYMNPGQDVISAGPKDTDISGLLNFIDNCTVPRGYVHNPDNIKQVRDLRNRVLHTSSMMIRESDFQNVITPLLLDLLADAGFLLNDPDAKTALEKIKEVKKSDFIITQDNEKKVLDALTNEIRQMNKLTSDEINKLHGRLDALNTDVLALKCSNQKDFNDLQDDVKKNDTMVSKATNMYEMLRKEVKQSKDLCDGMSQQLKDIQEQIKTTKESHKTLQLKLGDIEKRLSGMQDQIGNLGAEQTKLKDNQKEDRTHISVISKKQDPSKEQSELRVASDEMKGENKTLPPSEEEKSQLRQYLIDDYKQKLEVTLLPQWEQLPVSEIFTPSILICDEENKTHKKEEFRNLETYRQLFYKNDVLQKRVILLGEAGTGKTTFSKHLMDAWCETTTQTQFADVDVLKQFRYLFYVSCRFAEEEETLLEMINNQLFNDGRMKEVALYMLQNYPECCLIVLHGADEWKGSLTSETGRRGDITGLPGMAGVEDCVILITSRPWRFHALPTKTKGIFRRLEINGVKNVIELVFSILQKLGDPDPKQSSWEFVHQLQEKNMLEQMKMPLILIISLGGWIDGKSLYRSNTINYINMIMSFIRRVKGQAGWSEDKLLHLSSKLDNLESEWEQQAHELPELLLAYKPIKRYAGLFLSLGQLALNLLLEKEQQSLAFSKEVLKKYRLADEENDESINVCLALGVISKTETTTRGVKNQESYAFCHKTFQDFFAALWLASKYPNEKSKLYKCIKSYRDLMSYELLIRFLCGLDPEAGKLFWEFIAEEDQVMGEEDLQESRYTYTERMENVQDLVCKCMKEHQVDPENQKSDQIYFCIPHIAITSDKDIMLLCHVMEKYSCSVKSLALDSVTTITHNDMKQLVKSIISCALLQHLTLHPMTCREHGDACYIPVLDLQNHNKLERLNLCNLSVEGLLLPVEEARIISLKLTNVTMTHHDCEQLAESLTYYSDLEDLELVTVRCREDGDALYIPVLDLRKNNKLKILWLCYLSVEGLQLPMEEARITSLKLLYVKMTHHGWEQLAESLSYHSDLEYLHLVKQRCREYDDASYIPVLDLRKHNKLKSLWLCNLSVAGLLLPVEEARIISLDLMHVTMTHHDCEQLAESLSYHSDLEDLTLFKVRCKEDGDALCIPVLDLQNHKKLERLGLINLSFEGLQLPVEEARITSLELWDVKMTHHGWEQLAESLSYYSDLEYLSLHHVRYREDGDACSIPVLDLRKLNKLRTLWLRDLSVEGLQLPVEEGRITLLKLRDVTMTHLGWEQIAESLSYYSGLEYLSLDHVRCREDGDACSIPVLNLPKFNKLVSLIEVKKADFIITQDNEKKVLDALTNEISQRNKSTSDEINKLGGRLDTLNTNVSALKCSNQKNLDDLRDDVKKNDTTVSKTLHAEDQRKAEQTANEVDILHVKGDSLRIGLVGHESFEQDHDISVWPFLSEDVMLKADKYTDAAKRNNFLIQNVVICPAAVGRENIMQIPELLKTGGLIPRLIIPYAIELALKKKNRKKAHELLLSVATYIKQADSDNIVDAWPAYKENKPWDPIFVVLTISNFQGEWEEILGFPVFKRRYDFVSSEAAIVVNSKTFSENLLDFSDFNKLKNVILSREVIEKHSNITIMNTCSFRSKSGGKEIFKEKCVVIHCLVKGLIPFQEEPFPRDISGISVDVREGYVTMGMKPGESGGQSVDGDRLSIEGAVSQDVDCETVDHVQSPKYKAEYHSMCEKMQNLDLVGPSVQMGTRSTDVNQNLLMGTTISRTGSIPLTGTLGGFVRLHGGDMGFVTCAHVVGLNKDQTVSQPSHAELPPSHRSPGTICGHVERAIFAPGGCDDTGIDAAVVRISKRQPTDGDFIWVSPESQSAAGFSSTLKFTSGKVLTRDEIKENRRADVIKVGSQSGLTRGSLCLTETFVRISNREMILPGGNTVEFYNQMEIQSHAGSKAFFELGDSGSLVFMVLNNNELHCIGLAIGKTSYSSCLVTPMSHVLDSLGLEDKYQLLQFGALHGPPSNGFRLPNGRL